MRRAWLTLALWVIGAFVLLPMAGKTDEVATTDPAVLLPQSSEATRALLREREAFPGTDTPVAVIVYARGTGLTEADRAAVEADRAAFAPFTRAGTIEPAVASEDGQALLLSFPLTDDGQAAVDVAARINAELGDAPAGLDTALTGSVGALADIDDALGGTDTTLFLAAAAVVAVLLLITYRSPVLWLLPLISVALASQFAAAAVYLMGKHTGLTVTADSLGIMTVLVFGAGTDYALLLIARYREELHNHAGRRTAMAVALRRSLPAILASAGTVSVGMTCLLAARMNDMHSFGPIAAAGIIVALTVMMTRLPALLVVLGRWVFWPFVPRFGTAAVIRSRPGIWDRLARVVGRRPRLIWTVTALGLVALSFGVFGLRLGQPAGEAYTTEVGSVTGQRLIAEHYAGGASSPARIIVAASAADQVVAAATAVAGVASATSGDPSPDSRWVTVLAVLADPPDSHAAEDTIDRLRAATHAVPGADALVGGETATILDVARAADRDNRVVLPLVLIVVFAILVLLLRSLLAPLLLVASVALSYAASMGLAGLVFQALGHPFIMNALPLYAWLFLVTLGVDYTIFLMTRAREEVAVIGHRAGILAALTVTGGVITSAGLVLAGTFAVLVLLPFVTALQMGLIVALGVLLDTFVVRTLLVPALAIDIGARFWWPSRQAREPVPPPPIRTPERVG